MSTAILSAVGRVVVAVAAAIVAPSLFICRRRPDKGTVRSAATSRRDSQDICCAWDDDWCLGRPLYAPHPGLIYIDDAAHAKRAQIRQIEHDGSFDAVEGSRMVTDDKEKRAISLQVEQDPQTANSLKPPHDRIEMALVLIDEARILEKNSRGCDVPSLQQAAAKYLEGASNTKNFVEQQQRQIGCESAMKDRLQKIELYTIKADELNALVRNLTSPTLGEALKPEEFTGGLDSKPGPLPPTGGEVDDDNTSLEKPRQEMASECHEAVSYSKTHVKQRDRQRVSCESVLKQGDRQEAYNSNDQVNTNTSS